MIYESIFSYLVERGQPVRLLEIGVQNGGSLQIWSQCLPPGSHIVGIDIDPACAGMMISPNVSIRVGDASDPIALDRMLGEEDFDIIIDDGSHCSTHVITTFKSCFGRMKQGGLYIIEDLHCSYYASHNGGLRLSGTSIEWFKDLIDALNSDHFGAEEQLDAAELRQLREFGKWIARLSFFDSVLVIEKLTDEKRQPYRRVITGGKAHVVDLAKQIPTWPEVQIKTLLLPPATAGSFAPTLLDALASAREEVGRLQGALVQADMRCKSVEQRAIEAEAQLAESHAVLVEANRCSAALAVRLAEAERTAAVAETRLQRERESSQTSLTSLSTQLGQAKGEIARQQQNIEHLRDELAAARSDLVTHDQALDDAVQLAEEFAVELRTARAELAAGDTALREAEQTAAEIRAERDQALDERDRLARESGRWFEAAILAPAQDVTRPRATSKRLIWRRYGGSRGPASLSLIARADRARDERHWELAARFYLDALRRRPDRTAVWVQLGHVLKEVGKISEAEFAYCRAINLDADNFDALLPLGEVLKRLDRKGEAITALARALALAPSDHQRQTISNELAALGWQG